MGRIIKEKIVGFILFFIMIGIVAFSIYFVISTKAERDYVADNYIRTSSSYPVGRQYNFIATYTTSTGDLSLANSTGTSVSNMFQGNYQSGSVASLFASYGGDPNADLRPLVQAITFSWITKKFQNTRSQTLASIYSYATQQNGQSFTTRDSVRSAVGSSLSGLYENSNSDVYSIEYNSAQYSVRSCRCCCCLTESVVKVLCQLNGISYHGLGSYGHVAAVGNVGNDLMNIMGTGDGKRYGSNYRVNSLGLPSIKGTSYSNRYIGSNLRSMVMTNSADLTWNDLINNGLGVGTILMWSKVDGGSHRTYHIDIITYIDANYVYTAGAGGDLQIVCDYVYGADNKHSRSDTPFNPNGDSQYLSNLLYWKDSYIVTGN